MMKKGFFALVLLSFLLVACSTSDVKVSDSASMNDVDVVSQTIDRTDNSATIIIENTTVMPLETVVNNGDSVTFINNANRTVNLFVSGFSTALREDSKETHVFDEKGEYQFNIDNQFGGIIIVE